MAITIPPALQEILTAADASDSPLVEMELSGRLSAAIGDLRALPMDERRGALAVIGALEFQRKRLHSNPTWEMYWQPLGSIGGSDGTDQPFPDVGLIDDEILADWTARSDALRHPVLRARFADLAWEIGRYRRKLAREVGTASTELPRRPAVDLAWRAIDSYLDAVEHRLVADDFHAWFMLARTIELALSVSDPARVARAKRVLLDFQVACRDRDPKYVFLDIRRHRVGERGGARHDRPRAGRDHRGARAHSRHSR